MPIRGLDHIAITVADIDRSIDYYRRVAGATLLYEELWRAGKLPIAIVQIGVSRLSIHAAASPASPHALHPTPGSADLCFRWQGPLSEALSILEAEGVEIIEGPVPRPAADGAVGESIYFRDPDENLVEYLSTDVS